MKKKIIVITTGGTGGHVIPGITLAKAFQHLGHDVWWLGTREGIEERLVPQAKINFYTLPPIRGMKRFFSYGTIKMFLLLFVACLKSIYFFKSKKIDMVIAMGGYVAAPAGLAAIMCFIPLILHEQNAIAGRTNRLLAYFARYILASYPNSFSKYYRKTYLTGNPVRAELHKIIAPSFINDKRYLKVLVIGGSQGAETINKSVLSLYQQWSHPVSLLLWHQTGYKQYSFLTMQYQKINKDVLVDSFIEDIYKAYQWADVIISRAGAMSIAEITCCGRPSILIPYPYAANDHQRINASYLEKAGASIMVPQNELSGSRLQSCLIQFIENPKFFADMSNRAKAIYKPHGKEKIVNFILDKIK